MRFLGIDYGTKRVGLALSDATGRFALPHSVINNDHHLLSRIKSICAQGRVAQVVIGESLNYRRQPNPVMKQIKIFRDRLKAAVDLPITYEPEWLTSAAAERTPGQTTMLDASAAALILQTYLDRRV